MPEIAADETLADYYHRFLKLLNWLRYQDAPVYLEGRRGWYLIDFITSDEVDSLALRWSEGYLFPMLSHRLGSDGCIMLDVQLRNEEQVRELGRHHGIKEFTDGDGSQGQLWYVFNKQGRGVKLLFPPFDGFDSKCVSIEPGDFEFLEYLWAEGKKQPMIDLPADLQ